MTKYPNLLFVAACESNGSLRGYSNHGDVVRIAMPMSSTRNGTTFAAYDVGKLAGTLRALRAELVVGSSTFAQAV